MGLATGTLLGPYEIVSPLGAGGMGEVYRARDTRLDRTVAIKVLPERLSFTPELKQRFEREARAISQLNHPHICILHDIGSENGSDFLVMEYLEGQTLGECLEKGPLSLEELVKTGTQIAGALDGAHHAGIVHRDLKPGNVLLTKTGAKLLDFGLAKPAKLAASSDSGAAPLLSAAMTRTMTSPCLQSPLTQRGALVGTVQYMSPEQIQGFEAADAEVSSSKKGDPGSLKQTSFVIHYLDWQAGNNFGSFAPYSDYAKYPSQTLRQLANKGKVYATLNSGKTPGSSQAHLGSPIKTFPYFKYCATSV